MKKIYALTDYKGFFGSKIDSSPYRSGMRRDILKDLFKKEGYEIEWLIPSEIDFFSDAYIDQLVLYTSVEDKGYLYKSYIEDVIYALELQGAIVIPQYKWLRATNNKVFMEFLRKQVGVKEINNLKTFHFGTLEELNKKIDHFNYPCVFKTATGTMSTGVRLANTKTELLIIAKNLSRSRYLKYEIHDKIRGLRHNGYKKDSKYRKKFIIQEFIPGLMNDWKVLCYGKKYYALCRRNRKNDFRASGSGNFEFIEDVPQDVLNFAYLIYNNLNVPNLSLDIAFVNKKLYVTEFQAVHFGTTTIVKAPFYFIKKDNKWICKHEKSILEKEYVSSILGYIEKY